MRRMIVAAALFSLVGFVARGMWDGLTVQAEGGGRGAAVPVGNGDVNGDGKLNIADAIYIINNQFRGGPEPVPISGPPTGLPATGQTKCYDAAGAEIPCESADYPGQDGSYQVGCTSEGRFVENGDGSVTDNCTGLIWQQYPADMNGNGSVGWEDRLDWQDALKYCESLDLAGRTDWRLPNVRELQSIADYGRFHPAIDPVFGVFFPAADLGACHHWSSTTHSWLPGYSWSVEFSDGLVVANTLSCNKMDVQNFVRAVRGGL